MSSKIQVDLVLNSDRFSSAIRSDIYSVNLFTNAVVRAGNALRNLEKPLKIKLKDELLLLQKIMKEFMDDTKKDLEDTIKNLKEIDDRVKSIKVSYEKMGQTAKPSMSYSKANTTINNTQKKDDLSLGDIVEKMLNSSDLFRNVKEDWGKKAEHKSKTNNKKKKSPPKKLKKGSASNVREKVSSPKANAIKCICTCSGSSKKRDTKGSRVSEKRKAQYGRTESKKKRSVKQSNTSARRTSQPKKMAIKARSVSQNNRAGKGVGAQKKSGGTLKPSIKGKDGFNFSSIIKDSNKAGTALSKLGSVGTKAFGLLGKATKLFGLAFKAVPIIGWVLSIVDIIMTLKSAWDENFMGIQDIVSNAWNFIKGIFDNIVKGVTNVIDKIRNSPLGKAAGAVVNFVTGGGESGNSRAFGQRVIPYDNFPILAHQGESLLTANETRRLGEGSAVISKLADTIVVREDADIDKIANALISRLDKARFNMA